MDSEVGLSRLIERSAPPVVFLPAILDPPPPAHSLGDLVAMFSRGEDPPVDDVTDPGTRVRLLADADRYAQGALRDTPSEVMLAAHNWESTADALQGYPEGAIADYAAGRTLLLGMARHEEAGGTFGGRASFARRVRGSLERAVASGDPGLRAWGTLLLATTDLWEGSPEAAQRRLRGLTPDLRNMMMANGAGPYPEVMAATTAALRVTRGQRGPSPGL